MGTCICLAKTNHPTDGSKDSEKVKLLEKAVAPSGGSKIPEKIGTELHVDNKSSEKEAANNSTLADAGENDEVGGDFRKVDTGKAVGGRTQRNARVIPKAATKSQSQTQVNEHVQENNGYNDCEASEQEKEPAQISMKCDNDKRPIKGELKQLKSTFNKAGKSTLSEQKPSTLGFELQTITELERLEIMNAKFKHIDTNADGLISREEFLAAWEKYNTTMDLDGEDVFEDLDINETGFITQSDFNKWYLHETWNAIATDFRKMDKNGDLKISKEEFLEGCNNLCPAIHAENLFKKLDVNGDGMLSFKEFSDGTEQEYIVRVLNGYLNVEKAGGKRRGPNERTISTTNNIKKFHLVYKNGVVQLNNSTIMEAFNQIDCKMTDRLLTLEEFKHYFGQQGVSEIDCKKLFDDFKKSNDGYINFDDFKDYLIGSQPNQVSKK